MLLNYQEVTEEIKVEIKDYKWKWKHNQKPIGWGKSNC